MHVEGFGKRYEIPEEMIQEFMVEFKPVTEPGFREDLEELREMTGLVLDTIAIEPELLDFKEYKNDFIRAIAMREALARFGILYDA